VEEQEQIKEEIAVEQRRAPYQKRLPGCYLVPVILAFSAFVILIIVLLNSSFDLQFTHSLQSIDNPFFTWIMTAISWMGYMPQSFILAVLGTAVLYCLKKRREASVLLVAALAAQLLNILIKIAVQRPRPSIDLVHVVKRFNDYSFPSGHVMMYTVMFGLACYFAFTLLPRSWKRTALLIVFNGSILLIGISRIYLGAHWASDVAAAYLIGGAVWMAAVKFYQRTV